MGPGCGSIASDSPTAPSSIAGSAPQYPSIVGEWGGSSSLSFQYQGRETLGSSHCDVSASVREQTEGTFSGSIGLNGSSLSSDKQCPGSFTFTAAMAPSGTIISFQPSRSLSSHECLAVSQPIFSSGTASGTGFRFVMTDSALCRWPPVTDDRLPRTMATYRTFTVSIDRRRVSTRP
jgi:hypothetical protein